MTSTGYYPSAWIMEFFKFLKEKASLLLGSTAGLSTRTGSYPPFFHSMAFFTFLMKKRLY
jgi:hypothetical protein